MPGFSCRCWGFELRASFSKDKLSYTLSHLLALSVQQAFIELCWQVSPRHQVQSGTKSRACSRDHLWKTFPLLLFTVLLTISTHFNMPVFNASVYFLTRSPLLDCAVWQSEGLSAPLTAVYQRQAQMTIPLPVAPAKILGSVSFLFFARHIQAVQILSVLPSM